MLRIAVPNKGALSEPAAELLQEAGYKGEKVVVLYPTDHISAPAVMVLAQNMKKAGINVDLQSMDWASLAARRLKKDPPAQGGWNIFLTWGGYYDASTPVTNPAQGPAKAPTSTVPMESRYSGKGRPMLPMMWPSTTLIANATGRSARVRTGRRGEFAEHGWDTEDVPDPQDPATFTSSKLDWSEPDRPGHRARHPARGGPGLRGGHADLSDRPREPQPQLSGPPRRQRDPVRQERSRSRRQQERAGRHAYLRAGNS